MFYLCNSKGINGTCKPWRIKHKIMAFNRNESLINTGELGKAIKRRREELKLSLRDVADVTDVSASSLGLYRQPPWGDWEKIA